MGKSTYRRMGLLQPSGNKKLLVSVTTKTSPVCVNGSKVICDPSQSHCNKFKYNYTVCKK